MAHKPFVPGSTGPGDTGERPSHRPARFAQRIREELSDMVPRDLRDPRLEGITFLTITDVQVTPDLKHGTVMFALMGQEARSKEVEAALNQAAGFLRRQLMLKLNTKITPQLVYKYDKGLTNTMEIDALLKTIK